MRGRIIGEGEAFGEVALTHDCFITLKDYIDKLFNQGYFLGITVKVLMLAYYNHWVVKYG